MNTSSRQEVSPEFEEPPLPKQRKIIYFSSGETLDLEEAEEDDVEEQPTNRTPFKEPGGRARLAFKNVAILVGRMSLLACDFLGERLAGALGLNAAKYQYAIDQYDHEHKATDEDRAVNIRLPSGPDESLYGATGGGNKPEDKDNGCQNRAFQRDGDD